MEDLQAVMSSQFYIIGSGISGLVLAYELAKKGIQ